MEEVRKEITGYKGLYQVSNIGRVKSLDRIILVKQKDRVGRNITVNRKLKGRILENTIDNSGYCRLKLSRKGHLVHRLVFCTFNNISLDFLGQKSNTLVCHKNDIKTDNRIENLFLGTQKDNMNDMVKKGRRPYRRAKKQKIGFSDIENIKSEYKKLGSIYKVAPLFGVSYATISRVINGKIWKGEKL